MKNTRQKPHMRRSVKGKKFIAGKGKPKRNGSGRGARANKGRGGCLTPRNRNAVPSDLSIRERKQIFQEEIDVITKDLKKSGRARVPGMGILRLKHKKGIKKGTKVYNPFAKEFVKSKGRPARKIVKFNAMKALKEKIN